MIQYRTEEMEARQEGESLPRSTMLTTHGEGVHYVTEFLKEVEVGLRQLGKGLNQSTARGWHIGGRIREFEFDSARP